MASSTSTSPERALLLALVLAGCQAGPAGAGGSLTLAPVDAGEGGAGRTVVVPAGPPAATGAASVPAPPADAPGQAPPPAASGSGGGGSPGGAPPAATPAPDALAGVRRVPGRNHAALPQASYPDTLAEAAPDDADAPVAFGFEATGTVLGPGGAPASDVEVSLADAHGAYGMPTRTDAQGRYRLQLYSPDGRLVAATLYASGAAGLGLLAGLAPTAATPGLPPLTLVAPAHPLQVDVAGAPAGVPVQRALELVGADGTSADVAEQADGWHLANVPGAHYRLRVSATDLNQGLDCRAVRDPLPLDFSAPATRWPEALLDAPRLALPAALAPGGTLAWQAVAGASGYRVEASALTGSGYGWVGLVSSPSAALPPDPLPAGTYRLTVGAIAGPRSSSRQVLVQVP